MALQLSDFWEDFHWKIYWNVSTFTERLFGVCKDLINMNDTNKLFIIVFEKVQVINKRLYPYIHPAHANIPVFQFLKVEPFAFVEF